jgi:hypothetical protein
MTKPLCVYCGCDEEQTPLIMFTFHEKSYWICPQHLPILIHKPELLADKLPGMMTEQNSSEE